MEPESGAGAAPGLVRRRRALIAIIVGCVLCTAAGAGAALLLKSPAQAAAETAAPPADVLTAPVEHRVLSQTVVTRGKVTASQHVDISAGTSAGKDVARSVVTKVKVSAGQKLAAGRVLVEISGRPLFALPGALPAYRDLSPGMSGEDVTQLQQALTSIGHGVGGDRAGTFGAGTGRAVSAFYKSIGYTPPTTTAAGGKPGEPPAGRTKPGEGGATSLPSTLVVPLSEVVYVKAFPAHVDDVRVKVGDDAGASLLSLSAGTLMVDGSATPQEKGLIRPGQSVRIFSELNGRQVMGKVVSVAKAPAKPKDAQAQQPSENYLVKVAPDQPLSPDLNGEDVQLTVVAASSGTKVLAVPSSAISAGADGLTTVTVRDGKTERRVPVTAGMSGDGFVQITAQNDARLTPGEQVVVGVESAGGRQP
ncbi:HlyD family efflux transporter periplasmic adaptor subunit [Streptomyces violascens]|uniref:HlyD family efflux transporter periplasmic adaptor subunit n=1 Tax=Streptomyces violascens TaxID=67381 RepID=UPI00364CDC62